MNLTYFYLAVFLILGAGLFVTFSNNILMDASKIPADVTSTSPETSDLENETEADNFPNLSSENNEEFPEKSGGLTGMANPATVYCTELGYRHKIINEPEGQRGICIFPDEEECGEWGFYSGECGTSYNYCAQKGYETITKHDGKDSYLPSYSVCVSNGIEIGSVAELMNLSEELAKPLEKVKSKIE